HVGELVRPGGNRVRGLRQVLSDASERRALQRRNAVEDTEVQSTSQLRSHLRRQVVEDRQLVVLRRPLHLLAVTEGDLRLIRLHRASARLEVGSRLLLPLTNELRLAQRERE